MPAYVSARNEGKGQWRRKPRHVKWRVPKMRDGRKRKNRASPGTGCWQHSQARAMKVSAARVCGRNAEVSTPP